MVRVCVCARACLVDDAAAEAGGLDEDEGHAELVRVARRREPVPPRLPLQEPLPVRDARDQYKL